MLGLWLWYYRYMKFEDVEKARRGYNEKRSRLRTKTVLIVVAAEIALVALFVAINIRTFQDVLQNFGSVRPMVVVPLLMAMIFLVLLPIIFVKIILAVTTRKELEQYKKAYKGYFVGRELAKNFTEIRYQHEAGLDKTVLSGTGLIDTGDRYFSNDLTTGKYKNVKFVQADVHIEEEYKDNEGDTHYRTIFKGRFMIFELPKKFESRMMLSFAGEPVDGINRKTGKVMRRIETESVEFNKTFLVHAEDGMEALYILTPDFMERVQELGRLHNNQVSVYFVDNKMIVGINDGDDVFEPPSPDRPLDEKAEATRIAGEINLVTNIVDNLKLSRKV